MYSIISLIAVTSLFFTFIIVLATPVAKRDYSNVFPLTDGFPNPNTD